MLSENDLELLSAYLDGALSEAERTALEARLQTEPELRRELARLRATVDLIKTLPTLTPPRPLTLTPRMVRRPSAWTSATFSMLSAAAAVILLILGAALFTNSQNNPAAPASIALSRSVAILPTDTSPALTGTSAKLAGNAAEANVPLAQASEALGQNDLLQAAPTGTVQLSFAAQAPASDADQQAQNGVIQPQAASALDTSPAATPLPLVQQAAPLAMSSSASGGAAGGAPAPAALQPPATSTPTDTPTLTPTNTTSPTDTATPTASLTPTDTATPTPSPTPTPAFFSLASPETSTIGIGLIAVAVILLGIAVVTTVLRRRA